jgi:hypothetical protein
MGGRGPHGASQYAQHVHYQMKDAQGHPINPEAYWNQHQQQAPAQPHAPTSSPAAQPHTNAEAVLRTGSHDNGTSNYDYMHDITRNRDGLDQLMKRAHDRHVPEPAHDSATGVLRHGAHGEQVGKLQEELHRLGYDLHVDKQFGPRTEAQVKAFQQDHGLKPDGLVGPLTQAALDRELKLKIQLGGRHPDDVSHPAHNVFRQALDGVHRMDAERQRAPDHISQNVAGSLAVAAHRAGLTRIDHVVLSDDGSRIYAVQGELNSPLKRMAEVSTHQAVNTPLEQSSREMQQLASRQATHEVSQQQAQPAPQR